MKSALRTIAFADAGYGDSVDRGIAALLEVALEGLDSRGARIAASHICAGLALLMIQHEAERADDFGDIKSFG